MTFVIIIKQGLRARRLCQAPRAEALLITRRSLSGAAPRSRPHLSISQRTGQIPLGHPMARAGAQLPHRVAASEAVEGVKRDDARGALNAVPGTEQGVGRSWPWSSDSAGPRRRPALSRACIFNGSAGRRFSAAFPFCCAPFPCVAPCSPAPPPRSPPQNAGGPNQGF